MAGWAGLGYYARARNLLKCARAVVADHGGQFPYSAAALLALPGIGPYTAAAIGAIAFDRPDAVVDGNVERVMARLYDLHDLLSGSKATLTRLATGLAPAQRPGDYAQAVMDLGATICTPRKPACGICPWRAPCRARAAGTAESLPRKTPKPIGQGITYVERRADGAFLLERRPESGLLGGMLGWPGGAWAESPTEPTAAPAIAPWRATDGKVRHTFTHFQLLLNGLIADLPIDAEPIVGDFMASDTFRPSDLPTVMCKVFDLARAGLADQPPGMPPPDVRE